MGLTTWWRKLREQIQSPNNADDPELHGEPEPIEPNPRDTKVLAELDRLGVDLTHARHTIYFLYFPTKTSAEAAAFALRSEGYVTRADERLSPHTRFPWPVVAETIGIVNAEKMTQARVLLSRFAQEHGGEYDSWETALK